MWYRLIQRGKRAATLEGFLEEAGVAGGLVFGWTELKHQDRQVRWQKGDDLMREEADAPSLPPTFATPLPHLGSPCAALDPEPKQSS